MAGVGLADGFDGLFLAAIAKLAVKHLDPALVSWPFTPRTWAATAQAGNPAGKAALRASRAQAARKVRCG